jgi:hypothetical protein
MSGGRKRLAAWAVLLLGTIAAAAMLPQFAIFVPVVAAAWIFARLGFLPAFMSHRHPGARLSPGPDAPVTTFTATLEAESAKGPDERELLGRLLKRADGVAGPRVSPGSGDCIEWKAGAPRSDGACERLPLADWPNVREALERGDGLVVATRASSTGNGRGVRRIEAVVGGDRDLLEALALEYTAELRQSGVEIVTTGWLRHAERVRAARSPRPRA